LVKRGLFILFFVLAIPSIGLCKSGLSGFIAAGNNLAFPGAVRLGWNDWEFGLIYASAFGATKNFEYKTKYYTNLGFVLALAPALQAGIGYRAHMFWNVDLRIEIGTFMNINGFSQQQAAIGISF
jgi:hypothetical protein